MYSRRPGITLRGRKRRLARLDATGYPLIEVVGACGILYRDRQRIRRFIDSDCPLARGRRLVFAENRHATLQHLHVATIVIVIHAK